MYNEIMMEHYMMSEHKHKLEDFNYELKGVNPSCGDDISLQLKITDNVIEDAAFTGQGCAVSLSSTSIMIDLIKGKTIEETKILIEKFYNMIEKKEDDYEMLNDALAFSNIANMPARIKCACLSWKTVEKVIDEIKEISQ